MWIGSDPDITVGAEEIGQCTSVYADVLWRCGKILNMLLLREFSFGGQLLSQIKIGLNQAGRTNVITLAEIQP